LIVAKIVIKPTTANKIIIISFIINYTKY